MKTMNTISMLIAVCLFAVSPVAASSSIVMASEEVKWTDGPPSLPAGSKIAVLEGDPAKAEMVTFRLKFPPKYKVQPHTHPVDERVTVISGVLYLGMGEKFDSARAKKLSKGSFFVMPPNTAMFVWTEGEEAILQLNVMGPWGITYTNPADDPRKK